MPEDPSLLRSFWMTTMKGRMKSLSTILVSTLVLFGFGCVSVELSGLTPEQATESLVLDVGYEIVVQPTILGAGGNIVGWLGVDTQERALTINEWVAGKKVGLFWSIATQVETAESIAVQEAYDKKYSASPVGIDIPDKPELVYEEKITNGSVASESMASADSLMLPETWPEGDGGVSTSSLIWLSRTRYNELVNTRTTIVSTGLFDESLMKIEDATSKITSVVDKLSGLLDSILGTQESTESISDTQSLLTLHADPQWGEYMLLVDGVQTKVRVVEAKNAFASYKILANIDNPLILEIQLTPLSQGTLDLLSVEGFAKGFGGYEITQINKNPS